MTSTILVVMKTSFRTHKSCNRTEFFYYKKSKKLAASLLNNVFIITVTRAQNYMSFIEKGVLTIGTAIIFVCCTLNYTNSDATANYFVYASVFDNNVVEDLDEDDEVILNPILKNSDLKVEEVSNGLDFPTSMAFLGPDDILVLEKNEGTVRRILNGVLLEEPLLDVDVANKGERGMLGIAIANNNNNNNSNSNSGNNSDTPYVFLYYTESEKEGDDDDGKEAKGNRLYRYELENNKLVNPELLLDLPAAPGPTHNGGKIVIGPDDKLYLAIGDVGGHDLENPHTIINNKNGLEPDGRAGILRFSQDGKAVNNSRIEENEEKEQEEEEKGDSILSDKYPLNLYYAYGIRNSFGLDFDPVTGKLWDVETGRNFGEEINLVEPGFNSGWMKAQGIWELNENLRKEGIASLNDTTFLSELVDFDGKGKYSPPEFASDKMPITTSGMAFFHSHRLGKQYENDLFVGDFVNGMIFDFDLNEDRTQLSFDNKGPLEDKLAGSAEELEEVIFGLGFGGITDIKIGPYDGYLYVLSLDRGGDECKPSHPGRACIPYSSTVEGHIFRIIPAAT